MTDNSNLNAGGAIQPSSAVITNFSSSRAILPSFTSLPLKTVLAMDLRNYQITQKMDGRTAVKELDGFKFIGEQMSDGSFYAFDIDLDMGLRARWTVMQAFVGHGIQLVPCGHGAEFVEAVFANPKAEGIVLKNWDSAVGYDWAKCKKMETFDVRVTEKLRGAVAIEFENQSSGKVALSGPNYDAVKVGQVIEISAMKRNVSGKFREPRFVRIHPGKN